MICYPTVTREFADAVAASVVEAMEKKYPDDLSRNNARYNWGVNSRLEFVSGYFCPETDRPVASRLTVGWPYLYGGQQASLRLRSVPDGAQEWRSEWLAAQDLSDRDRLLREMVRRALKEWHGKEWFTAH